MRVVTSSLLLVLAACSAGPQPAATPTLPAQPTPSPVVVTPAPTYGTGLIVFGTSYDEDTLEVAKQKTTFKVTAKKVAWSASLSEPAGATSLTFIIARKRASGSEVEVYREKWPISNPAFTAVAGVGDLAGLVGHRAGTYVLRYLRGAVVLAEGEVRLVK